MRCFNSFQTLQYPHCQTLKISKPQKSKTGIQNHPLKIAPPQKQPKRRNQFSLCFLRKSLLHPMAMSSFHRPRVYRSIGGCCICRAKSSSSRFILLLLWTQKQTNKQTIVYFHKRSWQTPSLQVVVYKPWP